MTATAVAVAPTRDVNRDSGTDSANGGWLRRLVRPTIHNQINVNGGGAWLAMKPHQKQTTQPATKSCRAIQPTQPIQQQKAAKP